MNLPILGELRVLFNIGVLGYILVRASMKAPLYGELSFTARFTVGLTFLSALFFMSMNLWLATAWPHLTQLFVAWVASMGLFLAIVYEVLAESTEK